MYDAYVCLRDLKPQNTHGGTFTASSWLTRDLTEEQADPQEICALDANQFVLAPGTYRANISCPARAVNQNQARLFNHTTGQVLLLGTSERAEEGQRVFTRSHIVGRFTIPADQTLQIQHRCQWTGTTYGFGFACNFTDEIYTIAEFWREIEPE